MDINSLPAFLLAVLVIAASPGPAIVLILQRAGAHGFRASLVPGLARQVAGLCPASVAVHDDGQVCGQQLGQKLRRRPGLRGGVRVWRSAGRLAGRGRALLRHTFSL